MPFIAGCLSSAEADGVVEGVQFVRRGILMCARVCVCVYMCMCMGMCVFYVCVHVHMCVFVCFVCVCA